MNNSRVDGSKAVWYKYVEKILNEYIASLKTAT